MIAVSSSWRISRRGDVTPLDAKTRAKVAWDERPCVVCGELFVGYAQRDTCSRRCYRDRAA